MMTKYNNIFANSIVHKIYGTAGSGKTTYLLNKLEELFRNKITPIQIAFVSFTNKAVDEIVLRTIKRFNYFDATEFVNFRTIHSMCYATLKDTGKKIITREQLLEFAKNNGYKISQFATIEDGFGTYLGDKALQIESLSRLRMISLKQQWKDSKLLDCPFLSVEHWQKKIIEYKTKNNLIDFTDMLEMYQSQLDCDYCFIDECQDLSPLQWNVMNQATKNCKEIYIAGDDDQSIYNWAGGDANYFLNIKNDTETILSKTYRLNKPVFDLSRKILSQIKIRKDKDGNIKQEFRDGFIKRYFDISGVNFDKNEEYLILVRNRFQIKFIKNYLEKKGLLFSIFGKNTISCEEQQAINSWEKSRKLGHIQHASDFALIKKKTSEFKEYSHKDEIPKSLFNLEWYNLLNLIPKNKIVYIRNVLKNKYKLHDIPKIKLSTIHQAKGGECDNVIIFSDVSNATYNQIDTDNEHKVWYVAVTRAKKQLIIITETSNKFYKL